MRRFWWTWDIRMRWYHGFSASAQSFENNYTRAIDAAARYGVEGLVIWGFLRDRHGGIESAKRVCDHARSRGIKILPGVGLDEYGGVYYEGNSPYSLDTYISAHPECQAVNEAGAPITILWPPNDISERRKGCPSNTALTPYYRESVEWLLDTFGLSGFQIEAGDNRLCYCPACRAKPRITTGRISLSDSAERISAVVDPILARRPDLTIMSETYVGITADSLARLSPCVKKYPDKVLLSWQIYDAPGKFIIEPGLRCPGRGGNAAIRTNNDLFGGEVDDGENIARALRLARQAGMDSTYIYGEYPADWPTTRKNYEAWQAASA